jgi:hypothetical protein
MVKHLDVLDVGAIVHVKPSDKNRSMNTHAPWIEGFIVAVNHENVHTEAGFDDNCLTYDVQVIVTTPPADSSVSTNNAGNQVAAASSRETTASLNIPDRFHSRTTLSTTILHRVPRGDLVLSKKCIFWKFLRPEFVKHRGAALIAKANKSTYSINSTTLKAPISSTTIFDKAISKGTADGNSSSEVDVSDDDNDAWSSPYDYADKGSDDKADDKSAWSSDGKEDNVISSTDDSYNGYNDFVADKASMHGIVGSAKDMKNIATAATSTATSDRINAIELCSTSSVPLSPDALSIFGLQSVKLSRPSPNFQGDSARDYNADVHLATRTLIERLIPAMVISSMNYMPSK